MDATPEVEELRLAAAADPMLRACAAGGTVLRRPDHGEAVRWVQRALLDLGYSLGGFGADGVFGPETGAAVVAFKLDNGIDPPDPVVGAPTLAMLEELLAAEP